MAEKRIQNAKAAALSGLRRYPRQLWQSVRGAASGCDAIRSSVDLAKFLHSPLSAAWVGHATVLLRVGETNILTDPVFSERIGVRLAGRTFGPARLAPPALDVGHLPRIDLVLLSHAHFDHLDKPSLRRLAEGPAKGAMVITADRTRALIPEGFGEVVQLQWGRQLRLDHLPGAGVGLRVHAIRPRHWGARAGLDRHRKFNAYVLERQGALDRVLFAGDTAYTDAFDRIGTVDLSVFGIGAYEAWEGAHATPEQVWTMFHRIGGDHGRLMPMHHSTFDQGELEVSEPLKRLVAAAGPSAHRIVCQAPGEVWVKREPAQEQGPDFERDPLSEQPPSGRTAQS